MIVTVHIKAKLTWIVFQDKKSKYWVGVCDPLKISSQGETLGDLVENIEDALNLMLHNLACRNELDMFLRQHKWALIGRMPEKPSNARFEIPYDISRRSQHDPQTVLG
jgi:predicted RNase H-like HicB family nuclease